MQEKRHNKMADTPIVKLLISMSLPAMFSMFIQAMYNIVDSIYVAMIGENALTAVSLAFPVQNLIIAVAVGTGVGLNSLISRRLGERRQDQADKAATHGLGIAICGWLLFLVFGLFFTRLFFAAFTNDPTILEMGVDYTSIVTIFSIGCFVEISLEKTLQATGNMIWPMVFQLSGAVTNIILDPIFIFGWFGLPAMGVTGAAIATVLGQILSMFLAIAVIVLREHAVTVSLRRFRPEAAVFRDIFAVGLPAIIMQAIGSVMIMGLNSILIALSSTAVAVLGVYFKLQSFVMMPVFGLGQGALPIMGYNYGARNRSRLMKTLKMEGIFATIIMVIGTLLFFFIPETLLGLFSASPDMLAIGVPALKIIGLCFPFSAWGISISNFFQAVGSGVNSLVISLMRQLICILPLAWIFSRTLGLQAVWFAFPLAEMVSMVTSLLLLYRVYRNQVANLESFADEE